MAQVVLVVRNSLCQHYFAWSAASCRRCAPRDMPVLESSAARWGGRDAAFDGASCVRGMV